MIFYLCLNGLYFNKRISKMDPENEAGLQPIKYLIVLDFDTI